MIYLTPDIPDKWKNVIIAIVPKPGDSRECNNSRGISLISHIGKVLEICVHRRIKKILKLESMKHNLAA